MSNDCFSELLQELETNKHEILTASCSSKGDWFLVFQPCFPPQFRLVKNTLCPLNMVLIIKRSQAGTLGGVEKCQTIQKLHLVVWDFLQVVFFLKSLLYSNAQF